MDVTETLEDFRRRIEGCGLAAFTDISSQMVLAVASAVPRRQEELDVLPAAAAAAFRGPLAEGAAAAWTDAAPGAAADMALTMTEEDATLYLRSGRDGAHVLVCVFDPDVDLKQALPAARDAADALAAA